MKKNIFLWSLYDFANSIIMIVFLFYFSQWLVIDSGKPDWWYNATLIISSILFIAIAPVLGQRLDVTGKKLRGLRITSVLMTIFYIGTACVMLFAPLQAVLATVLFTMAMFTYLLSFIYYTPMINDVANNENRGWVSGLGLGANYIGQVFGLLITLPFATGVIHLMGAPGRAQTLMPAILLFVIAAVPMLIAYKESASLAVAEKMNIRKEYSHLRKTIVRIFSIRNLAFLFLAYFLFSDALLTFSNNFPIFLEKVFAASDSAKTYLSAGILALSGVGSLIFGKVADRKGTKHTLLFILLCWVIIFPLLAFCSSFTMAIVICLIGGIFFGPIWGVSRAMVSEYAPHELQASSFSFYTVAERFATCIGPLTWTIVLASTASKGNASYSYAVASMAILVLLGYICIRKIRPAESAPKESVVEEILSEPSVTKTF